MLSDTLSRPPNHHLSLIISLLVVMMSGCEAGEEGISPPLDQLYNPLGLTAHPDGRYLLVSNSVFDRQYNASSLLLIDTFTDEVISERGVEVGLFAGEIGLTKICSDLELTLDDPACEARVVGVIPSRDRGTLTSFEVVSDAEGSPQIRCGQKSGESTCGGGFVQASLNEEAEKSGPFSVSMTPQGAYLTHLNSGLVSHWLFTDKDPLITFGCQVRFGGANFVAQHPNADTMLVSDRLGLSIYQAEIAQRDGDCQFNVLPPLRVGSGSVIGEGRGLAFSADGSTLFHVQSGQEVLHIYQTLRVAQGQFSYRLLASVPVGREANLVRVPGVYPGGPQSASQGEVARLGQGLVYVTAFADNRVLVIDPQRGQVINSIEVGEGPYDISFMLNEQGELRGYVSLFKDQAISVLDLQPESPTRFRQLKVIR